MSRRHIPLIAGEIGPGSSDIFTVTVNTKVLVSSMILSASVPSAVPCEIELWYTPDGGASVQVAYFQITNDANTNPVPAVEPWIVLLSGDGLQVKNQSAELGPNLQYILSGIEFDPP